jgi:hypothetical protein
MPRRGMARRFETEIRLKLTQLLLDLIDLRSFSNLWYWIALAVTWSTASHWVLGIPFDMVIRARRQGGAAMDDLMALARININRIQFIVTEAGTVLAALAAFAHTTLALLGFWYGVEFCQAVFLLLFPVTIVGIFTARTARRIRDEASDGEQLCHRLHWHRILVQAIGVLAITVTAAWGMLVNFNVSPLG